MVETCFVSGFVLYCVHDMSVCGNESGICEKYKLYEPHSNILSLDYPHEEKRVCTVTR